MHSPRTRWMTIIEKSIYERYNDMSGVHSRQINDTLLASVGMWCVCCCSSLQAGTMDRRQIRVSKFIEFEFRVEFRVTRKCNWWNSVRNNFAPYLHIICMLLCIIQLDKFQQSSIATRCIECRWILKLGVNGPRSRHFTLFHIAFYLRRFARCIVLDSAYCNRSYNQRRVTETTEYITRRNCL